MMGRLWVREAVWGQHIRQVVVHGLVSTIYRSNHEFSSLAMHNLHVPVSSDYTYIIEYTVFLLYSSVDVVAS